MLEEEGKSCIEVEKPRLLRVKLIGQSNPSNLSTNTFRHQGIFLKSKSFYQLPLHQFEN
jgi:hypothetical protein